MTDRFTDDVQKEQSKKGEFSTAMGVNTRPSHKLTYNGYWINFDPNMPESMFRDISILLAKKNHSE